MSKVAQYLDRIFANLPQNERNLQYKDNLKQQMEVVFKAECAAGKSEEDALMVAISAAPNYEAICETLEIFADPSTCDAAWYRNQARWSSFWFSFALALFVVSPFGMIALSVWKHAYNLVAGLAVLIFAIGIGVGVLLYALREKRKLSGKKPNASVGKASVWHLAFGILLCIVAGISAVICLALLEGKALSWECASTLVYAAAGVLEITYFVQLARRLRN